VNYKFEILLKFVCRVSFVGFLLCTLGYFVVNTANAQTIFDDVGLTKYAQQNTTGCDFGTSDPAQEHDSEFASFVASLNTSGGGTTTYSNATLVNRRTIIATNSCSMLSEYQADVTINGNVQSRKQSASYQTNGSLSTIQTCPPDGNVDYGFSGTDSDDNTFCFKPADLALVDTCSVNSPLLAVGANTEQNVCQKKTDGSMCSYSRQTANGQDFYAPVEPDSCFDGGFPYEQASVAPPSGQGCQDIGVGTSFCPDNEADMCPNGVCQSGCGTIDVGGGPQFGCFSRDTDGDTIGDYKDTDIDGDGINNDDDPDDDNDGIPDEDDPDTPTNDVGNGGDSSGSQDFGALESLLGTNNQIGSNIASGIGAINTKLDEIKNTEFATTAGNRTADAFDALYGQADIDAVKLKGEQKTAELKTRVAEIQRELKTLFTIDNSSATFEARTVVIGGRSYNISFNRFSSSFTLIGSIVLLLAVLTSIVVILGGKS